VQQEDCIIMVRSTCRQEYRVIEFVILLDGKKML